MVYRHTRDGRKVPVREGLSHTSGAQYRKNAEKENTAVLLGWRGFRFTTDMIRDGSAIEVLKHYFANTIRQPNQLTLFGMNGTNNESL